MRRTRFGSAAVLLLLCASSLAANQKEGKPRIEDLVVREQEGRVVVSYRLADALSEDVLERIRSGIPVRFRHRVEIESKRAVPLWPARLLARTVLESRVSYDSLTRRYELFRRVEIRRKGAPPPVEHTVSTDSESEMREWMTRYDEVEVYDPAGPLEGERLRVVVVCSLGRRYVLMMFPASITASAEQPLAR